VLEYFTADEFLVNLRVSIIQLHKNSALMSTPSSAKSFYKWGMLKKAPFVLAGSESLSGNLLTGHRLTLTLGSEELFY
jgi:hypothetical protein